MGTIDTWVSCCSPGQGQLCSAGSEAPPEHQPSLVLSLPDPLLPPSLPAWLPGVLGSTPGLPGQECHLFILYLSLTWERCPRKAEHQQVRLCVPSAAWKCGRAQDCPFLQEELSLHSWCSWAAFTGVFPL